MIGSVLVTGATAGIGKATVEAFVAAGAGKVYAVGRRADRLEALRDEMPAVVPVVLDVADRLAIETLAAARPEWFAVDVLVNNAGLARGVEPMQSADPADWDEMIDTNVKGLLAVTRSVVPGMIARGRGHVVNLGSVAGRWVYPGGGVYCATKYAVRALSEGLRYDLAGTDVRVTNIEPGLVETEFSEVRFRGDTGRAAKVYQDADVLRPEDIADAIVWSCERPARVNIQEMVVYPTCQAGVRDVVRR